MFEAETETETKLVRTGCPEYPWVRCPVEYDEGLIRVADIRHDPMIVALDQDALGRPIVARAWIDGPIELWLVADGNAYRWIEAGDETDTEVSAPTEAEAIEAAMAAWPSCS